MTEKSKLIQVGEMSIGFSENILPDTVELTGKKITLYLEDDSTIDFRFHDEHSLSWETVDGSGTVEGDREEYLATCPRENIFFVDYLKKKDWATTVSIVLDFEKGISTVLTGSLPDKQSAHMDKLARVEKGLRQTGVNATFKAAVIDKKFTDGSPRHEPTDGLIGKRIQYVYSQKDIYEHIYLNEKAYTWHCLSGIEKGMADTDYCHYYKIAKDLYLFVWREKLVPTLGVVMVNLEAMKTTGKIFGYESDDFKTLINFPVGAFAHIV